MEKGRLWHFRTRETKKRNSILDATSRWCDELIELSLYSIKFTPVLFRLFTSWKFWWCLRFFVNFFISALKKRVRFTTTHPSLQQVTLTLHFRKRSIFSVSKIRMCHVMDLCWSDVLKWQICVEVTYLCESDGFVLKWRNDFWGWKSMALVWKWHV